MCGLCGVLGSREHWTDSGKQLATRRASATFRRERLYQIEIINKIIRNYGLHVADWHGTSLIISTNSSSINPGSIVLSIITNESDPKILLNCFPTILNAE